MQGKWQAYPQAGKIPKGALCGRVIEKSGTAIHLLSGQEVQCLKTEHLLEQVDPELGPSCPVDCLRPGDWVTWLPDKKGLYLLAPCLVQGWQKSEPIAQRWSEFLGRVEDWFLARGFLHLRTPYLVPSPGVDHHIGFLSVEASQTRRQWTLPTSPEIHLKKFLCQGYTQIFEIKNCFRDDLPGPQHRVEFTMLEWYRAFSGLNVIVDDLKGLLEAFTGERRVEEKSMPQAFFEGTGFQLKPDTSRDELLAWAGALGIDAGADDDWNDLFFRIFLEKIEPALGLACPVIIKDFPAQQASLAQLNSKGWAQRFELYWKGVELANAYLEVNSPCEIRERFAQEAQLRVDSGHPVAPLDSEFFDFLESGMPPASGIALGLDRLFALMNGRDLSAINLMR